MVFYDIGQTRDELILLHFGRERFLPAYDHGIEAIEGIPSMVQWTGSHVITHVTWPTNIHQGCKMYSRAAANQSDGK